MSAKHQATVPFERKAAVAVLVAGGIAALACAFGSIWVVRVGVVLALVAATVALAFSFSEIRRLNEAHRLELRAMRRSASEAAAKHHAESMELIETFRARYAAHAEQVGDLRAELAATQTELSTVRGNLVSARAEAASKTQQVVALEAAIAEHETELAVLTEQLRALETPEVEGEVVTIPQRAISRKALAAKLPTAAELWSNGDHPTSFTMESVDFAALMNGTLTSLEQRKHA